MYGLNIVNPNMPNPGHGVMSDSLLPRERSLRRVMIDLSVIKGVILLRYISTIDFRMKHLVNMSVYLHFFWVQSLLNCQMR